jgi:hypothetical protein
LQLLAQMRWWLALVVVGVTTSSAAASPGAIFIPPAEVDIGAGTPIGDVVVGSSTELRVGVHSASLYWKPTPVDIGIGYAGSYRDVTPSYAARASGYEDSTFKLHGLYFSASYAIEKHRHWRTWLGARVEGLNGSYGGHSYSVIGTALRIAAELYSAGVGGAGDSRAVGFFAGTFGLGVYVEGTRRFNLPAELGPNGVGAGLTMRIPFIAALGS